MSYCVGPIVWDGGRRMAFAERGHFMTPFKNIYIKGLLKMNFLIKQLLKFLFAFNFTCLGSSPTRAACSYVMLTLCGLLISLATTITTRPDLVRCPECLTV